MVGTKGQQWFFCLCDVCQQNPGETLKQMLYYINDDIPAKNSSH